MRDGDDELPAGAKRDDVAALARMADEGGLDFMIPIARWKGVPGLVHNRLWSYETLTHAAALSGLTKRIALFATVHTPVVHPIFAAKAMTTIDHASHGRAGLNIVCGWDQYDFAMFGHRQLEHDRRYEQAWEWFEVWSRLMAGEEEEFDFDGQYYPGLAGVIGQPGSLQTPRPLVVCAGSSAVGRDYAVRTADYILTGFHNAEQGRALNADIAARCAAHGRAGLPSIAPCHAVCRPTRAEAEAFYRYYSETMADTKGLEFYIQSSMVSEGKTGPGPQNRTLLAAGNGTFPLVGTPEDVVHGLLAIRDCGFAGSSITLLNFLDELPFFLSGICSTR